MSAHSDYFRGAAEDAVTQLFGLAATDLQERIAALTAVENRCSGLIELLRAQERQQRSSTLNPQLSTR